jgi:hypothetical protein
MAFGASSISLFMKPQFYLRVATIKILTDNKCPSIRGRTVIERDKTTREQVLKRIMRNGLMNSGFQKSDFVNVDSEIAKRKTEEILKILKIKQKES